MTYPYPSDSRCWHCDQQRTLTWIVYGQAAAWMCRSCLKEQTEYAIPSRDLASAPVVPDCAGDETRRVASARA